MLKSKILHIAPALPPTGKGGEEKCIIKIIKYFSDKYDLTALIRKGKVDSGDFKIYNYDSKGTIKNYLIFIKKLTQSVKNSDLIHYHYPNYFYPNIIDLPIFLFIFLLLNKKFVIHIHLNIQFENFFGKIFYFFMLKIIFHFAKAIIVPTKFTKNLFIKKYQPNPNKIYIVPYGVSDEFFKRNLTRNKIFFKKILYIGRLHPWKQVDRIILAIEQMENYHLEIYGDGPERDYLQRLAKGLKNISFKGFKASETEIAMAFENADLMVLPSKAEEMPLSILESLAARVPVLCSQLPSIQSRYKDLIFYTTGEINDIRSKIEKITSKKNENKINRGRTYARKYTWSNVFLKIQKIYYEVIKKN